MADPLHELSYRLSLGAGLSLLLLSLLFVSPWSAEGRSPAVAAVGLVLMFAAGLLFARSYLREAPGLSALLRETREALTRAQGAEAERDELAAIFGGLDYGLIAVSSEQNILRLNDAALRLLRMPVNVARDKRLFELVRIPKLLDTVAEVLVEGRPLSTELRLHEPGGDRVLELRVGPLAIEPGGRSGAVLLIDDVTRLKRLETMRREFLGNVSHELKTPLTAIRGLIETVVEDPEMPAKTQRRFLRKTRAQAHRLTKLVSDLLTISRVESEQPSEGLDPIDVRAPMHRAMARLKPAAEERNVRLEASFSDTPLWLCADMESIEQLAGNLVDNAIKYSPDGGLVSVTLERREGIVALTVSDQGPGIAALHHERVFERFYRIDQARSRELGGTGLGLSIVKHVAHAHGGRVSLESRPGEGARFSVELPLLAPTGDA
jgi:two-component system, OmpR family, phosphate regulon sensor histidine kinase PhoR